MKRPLNSSFFILIILSMTSMSHAQDAIFTQWRTISQNTNPALTGDYSGNLRIQALHRPQWNNVLRGNGYQSSAVSFEYKFEKKSSRQINIGSYLLDDRAGSSALTTRSFNFSTSITQEVENDKNGTHTLSAGLNAGLYRRSIDLDELRWLSGQIDPNIKEHVAFADISAGLSWQYQSENNLKFQLGSAIYHINRANNLYIRKSVHALADIPVTAALHLIPSILFSDQGPHHQILTTLQSKWLLKNTHSIQVGVLTKRGSFYSIDRSIHTYGISASTQFNSFLLGISYELFQDLESNAFEFSLGYVW